MPAYRCDNLRGSRKLGNDRDPLIGNQDGIFDFAIPKRPIRRKITGLPAFTTGGAYFFLPGISTQVPRCALGLVMTSVHDSDGDARFRAANRGIARQRASKFMSTRPSTTLADYSGRRSLQIRFRQCGHRCGGSRAKSSRMAWRTAGKVG